MNAPKLPDAESDAKLELPGVRTAVLVGLGFAIADGVFLFVRPQYTTLAAVIAAIGVFVGLYDYLPIPGMRRIRRRLAAVEEAGRGGSFGQRLALTLAASTILVLIALFLWEYETFH